MNPTNIRTFKAYSDAVDQRTQGAAEASKYGAVAAVVRSMSLRLDDFLTQGLLNIKEFRYLNAFQPVLLAPMELNY